jgi:hypothetical protein
MVLLTCSSLSSEMHIPVDPENPSASAYTFVMVALCQQTPNPYEAPTCQEANEVRRKGRAFRDWVHAWSKTLGVTDLISNAGFTETPCGVSCTKHLLRVCTPGADDALARAGRRRRSTAP